MLPVGGMIEGRRVGEAVNDVPSRALQGLGHGLRMGNINRIPVIFHVVHTPVRPLSGILSEKGKLAVLPVRFPLAHDVLPLLNLTALCLVLGSAFELVERSIGIADAKGFIVISGNYPVVHSVRTVAR